MPLLPLREQSNVGERTFLTSLWEGLIGRNYQGALENVPMLATSWRRIDERTVDVNVQRLRKILTEPGYEAYIQTVRGFGYRFGAPAPARAE